LNWISIKNEYISTDISYRKLTKKYDVSFATLRARAKKEDWVAQKVAQKHKISTKIAQKTADKIVEKEVDRIGKLISISDSLLEMIATATNELNKGDNDNIVKVDTYKLRQITASLKDIKDIQKDDTSDKDKNSDAITALVDAIKGDKHDNK